MIDGVPSSAKEIISMAKELDHGYATQNELHATSVAARILRDNHHKVEENPDYGI